MNMNIRNKKIHQHSILLCWVIITQHVLIEGSNRNLWSLMFVNDSKSSKSPSWETTTNSELSCAISCSASLRGACRGFFFNKQVGLCSMYDVTLEPLPLVSSPGTNGYRLGPLDCSNVDTGGIYTVYPRDIPEPMNVYCEVTSQREGWLVFQRRTDGSEDFFRTWDEYKDGFGDLSNEFWLGNTYIHQLTKRGNYELRIDLEDFENETRYATYTEFYVSSQEDFFKLHVTGYHGNAGDGMRLHNGMNFSAKDRDLDPSVSNCSELYNAAWWYNDPCHSSNLNGIYYGGKHDSFADGVEWSIWRGNHYSLKRSVMMMRPRR